MKTRFFTTTFAVMTLLFTFNSCREDEENLSRALTEDEMKQLELLEDGCVVSSLDNLFCSDVVNRGLKYYIGITAEDVEQKFDKANIEPYSKYYWKLRNYDFKKYDDGSWSILDTYAESEVRSFYYVPKPEIVDLHNVEGDWATVVKWNTVEGGQIHDIQVTMTPDKDCNYDKAPIEVPAGQDSCYISAGDLGNPKYQIYHNWWDEANGKYYEPVVYDYKVTISYDISGDIIPVSATKKGIFLNTDGYVADDYFNVYRYGKIGNRIWMLDDLRGLPSDTLAYYIVKLESGLDVVLYSDIAYYENDKIIPKGFHLSTNEDWLDLEEHFGVYDYDSTWYTFNVGGIYKYTPSDSAGIKSFLGIKPEIAGPDMAAYLCDIYSNYYGRETCIRDYLISDNEWKTINEPTAKLKAQGYITGFNAHPVGVPHVLDYEKKDVQNPYLGYGAVFTTKGGTIKSFLWSGSTGICRIKSNGEQYGLYRCVKDE